MYNHLENYDKLTTPNAKMLALRKAEQAIEEEKRKLFDSCVQCKCGFLMFKSKFDALKQTYINPNDRSVSWVDCPVCNKQIYSK